MTIPTLRQPFYAIVTYRNQFCLAHCNGRAWEFDRTSEVINEMLQNGLISLDSIQAWINTRSTALPQG